MILETKRLKVRQFGEDDYSQYSKLDIDPEVMRYIGKVRSPQQMYDRFSQILEYYKSYPQFGIWALSDLQNDFFHGWVCLKHLDNTEEIEIGYRLMYKSWGKGYATEASFGLLNYGFRDLNLGRIVAVTIEENQPSQRVLRKIGMKFEKMAHFYNVDVLYFGLSQRNFFNNVLKSGNQ